VTPHVGYDDVGSQVAEYLHRHVDGDQLTAWRRWLALAAAHGERERKHASDAYDFKAGEIIAEAKHVFREQGSTAQESCFRGGRGGFREGGDAEEHGATENTVVFFIDT